MGLTAQWEVPNREKYRIARGIGIDIVPERIKEANENLAKAGVGDRVRFINADLFESNFHAAAAYDAAMAAAK